MTLTFCSWALLDRATGEISGSPDFDVALTTTQSMIKSWIVADFLRHHDPTAAELELGVAAIVDSDDNATETLYLAAGADASIARLIAACDLTETVATPGWWSMTAMSARDACRMGLALLDGRAAGPQWTPFVLEQMRSVRGSCAEHDQHETTGGGRWGIIDGLPAPAGVAIKNGWTRMSDGEWDVNCLALHEKWVLAILMGYPAGLPLQLAADHARTLTAALHAAGRLP
ncbi:hypothetical protein Rhe02_88110 [Rhizocola hellebori]|uniref:Beta-lactamase class A catalytic domain-containing protein n=1 Tax=Rhizocola hellebori TaxID=1392758 RepID=A0A8J3QJ86_9ACTN|nr:hypothetical protein [Rhizocola hellebori]GIH10744.1 hypothetical protein Rhe02_88110 [Rhizocola hellebori]